MTNARFKEIVSLFLDREISPRDLELLRRELQKPERKREFEEIRRIHNAEKQAIALLFSGSERPRSRPNIGSRACNAIHEARVQFEERRKGIVLLGQFTAATAAIALTVGFLYRGSVQALEVDETPTGPPIAGADLRQIQPSARLQNAVNGVLVDNQGRAVALVSFEQPTADFVLEEAPAVSEGSLFGLSRVFDAFAPSPSPTMAPKEDAFPVRELPGTSAPVVLVDDSDETRQIAGFSF